MPHSRPSVTRLTILVLLALSTMASMATAQQLLIFGNGALPPCAQQCQVLSQAQAACIPPAAPVTNAVSYEGCFCQSAYLTTLKTSPAVSCGSVCSGTDLSQIAQWYTNNCADGGVAAAARISASTTTAAAAPATTTAAAPAGTTTTSSSDSGSSGAITEESTPEKGGWWHNHWKWVIMLIAIIIGFALVTAIAILLRKRHRRNQDKTKGRFNDGITARSTTAVPAETAVYGEPAQPSRSDHRLASAGAMSRVRERDMTPPYPREMERVRGTTPIGAMEQGRVLSKNERGMNVSEDEIRPVR